jgi:1,4-alpha-glucan branching enzyme
MLFMGQEFLEDKHWADDFKNHANLLPYWAGLDQGDMQMHDHLRFVRELLAWRKRCAGLRGQGFRVIHAHDQNRVLAFHRWVEHEGNDAVVVVNLAPMHQYAHRIGFPLSGWWNEAFNSDVYESWVNPQVAGNGGRADAQPMPMHSYEASAELTLPANSLLVFTRV